MLAGKPLTLAKKTWGGQMHRRRLLEKAGILLPDDLVDANEVPPDDVLDAAVAAWSAHRIACGEAISFPSEPSETDGSRRIAIWA